MIIITTYAILTTAASITWLIINPITLALTILVISISVAILFAYRISSWIAFLVFLIYIGGIIVIFTYFVAISPNITINIAWPILFSISTFILLILYINQLNTTTPIISNTSISLNTFYATEINQTLIILALLLLLTIVIVVKLASINKGPLRPFN